MTVRDSRTQLSPCHPERSEGSGWQREIPFTSFEDRLRCAQNDSIETIPRITHADLRTPILSNGASTKRNPLFLAAFLVPQMVVADEPNMVRLAGTPERIGTIWGQRNKEIIRRDLETGQPT